MPGRRDEDIDWLYGRPAQRSEPEPTRVMDVPAGLEAPPRIQRPGPAAPPSPYPSPQHRPDQGRPDYAAPNPAYGQPRPKDPYGPPPGGPVPPVGPGGPGGPGGPAGRPPRRRRPVRTALRTVAVLLLVAVVWLVGVPAYAWSQIGRVDDTPTGQRPGNQPGQTFLLVGSDSRQGLTKAQQKKLGTGSTAGQRTDTIMLVYVPTGGKPALISIPRDSYVPIPGNGTNKINAAYAFGGPDLLVKTVEQSTGLRVDGYMEIGFGGFVNVIDALGGISMCVPSTIKDTDSHLNLKKGCQLLDGTTALGYVRMRKADPRGDLGRVERQRQMLAAVAKKGAAPATVLNPVRYWRLSTASAKSIKLGEDTSFFETVAMGLAMRTIAAGGGYTLTVPVSNPGASTPVGSAVLWDDTRAQAMFGEIAKGDTSKLGKYAK